MYIVNIRLLVPKHLFEIYLSGETPRRSQFSLLSTLKQVPCTVEL